MSGYGLCFCSRVSLIRMFDVNRTSDDLTCFPQSLIRSLNKLVVAHADGPRGHDLILKRDLEEQCNIFAPSTAAKESTLADAHFRMIGTAVRKQL
jgi:hypothetical protein